MLKRVFATMLVALSAMPVAAEAATITVDTTADAAAGDGHCALREAIVAAETDSASGPGAGECPAGSGDDTINFSVLGSIDVGSQLPVITKDLVVRGPGAQNLAVDGGGQSRLFVVNGGTVRLEGLTLRRAQVLASDANGNPVGAALLNRATVALVGVVFSQNRSLSQGGAVYNEGTVTTDSTTFAGNRVDQGFGSALYTFSNVVMVNSTVTGGDAGSGGSSLATGGAARLGLSFVTVTGNVGASGGGVSFGGHPQDFLTNSVVAGNAGDQCANAPTSLAGGSLASDGTCGPGAGVGDPKLQPLALNGGSTPTHALGAGSAAVDVGTYTTPSNELGCSSTVFNGGAEGRDQRGVARPQGPACDAGAYEQPPQAPGGGGTPGGGGAPGGGAAPCANGTDDDRDGFTDADDPDCKSGRGVEDNVDSAAIACSARNVVLLDVLRASRRGVRFLGIANPAFAGAVVEIVSRGNVVERATIGEDGVFKGRARAPSRARARTARYMARLGPERSLNLKLRRRMSVRALRVKGGKVVMEGAVRGARHRRLRVDLLARSGDCDARFEKVGRTRLRRNGRFRVTADVPEGVTIAVFRARTRYPGRWRTFTLPRPLELRQGT